MPPYLKRLVPGLLLAIGHGGCAPHALRTGFERPLVTVSIPPQKYIVEHIAGDLLDVNVMVGPGESPATYEPRPSQLAALRSSTAYFAMGVPFEKAWLPRFRSANPGLLIVNTVDGLDLAPQDTPHHHEEGGHHPSGPDPHVWLHPDLVKRMASIYCTVLQDQHPEHAAVFEANLEKFHAGLDDLHAVLKAELDACSHKTFMVFHPSWGYFARAFDLKMLSIEQGGQEPSAAEVADLITRAREEGVRVVVVQPEFNASSAETIARQIGARLVRVSPLDEDWADMMGRMTRAIAEDDKVGAP